MKEWNISEKAAALHRDALVWDMTLPWVESIENKDTTLPRFAASGVNFISLTVATDFSGGVEAAVRAIGAEMAMIRQHADKLAFAGSVDDILSAKKEGKLALGFHFQGTNPFYGDLSLVEVYYRLGVRHALLAYNQKNFVGDGCHERTDGGISRFGLGLIAEMNRVGMLVDCSHSGYQTTMEAMEASTAPVIFSHSNANALHDHERNIKDDQIKACAKTGGVIGVNGIGFFLDAKGEASVETFCRHVDYIAKLVGPEHVGIGLDFVFFEKTMYAFYHANPAKFPKGYPPPPWQFFSPEDVPKITETLLKRGYKEKDVRGILGENFLRVARAVWK